ncbi:hypothetical protein MKX01_042350 [Papaver californicum]|nr:hypothetical protein MKX01_042350 [Papaver californicum]
MASSSSSTNESNHHNNISKFIHSTSSALHSILNQWTLMDRPTHCDSPRSDPQTLNPRLTSSSICVPLLFSSSSFHNSDDNNPSVPPQSSSMRRLNSNPNSNSGFPSTVRIPNEKGGGGGGGGPAFVGQVFSMCDVSGTGLMAVSTHIQIPFLSKRTPEWLKKMFAAVIKNDRDGPMFRFFMDIGDAVSYVKQLNVPSGVVGACRLDLAYEHFKEKPHMFQFVPNEKQVKEAKKLLMENPHNNGVKTIDGVPVFTAENLDIAIATNDGIKWYTPYFFDKKTLDNILEDSVDQHFHTLIQNRRMQRRRDVIDDSLSSDAVEDTADSLWEPPEVQEVMDEMGQPTIPLSVISKVAELQLHHAVDKVMLGNRWLRKATGIQPKFPYMVDSFERRTAASFLKDAKSTSAAATLDSDCENNRHELELGSGESKLLESAPVEQNPDHTDFRFPFGGWFSHPWSRQEQKTYNHITSDTSSKKTNTEEGLQSNPLLPKITMVGISTGETGQVSRSSLKKTMEDLTKKLEETSKSNENNDKHVEVKDEERDPLFVANVGDYYSGLAKTGSSRWVRARSN